MKLFRAVSLVLVSTIALLGHVAPSHAGQIRPLIQGVVVDQGGRYVDDVQVTAVRPDGTVAASALSYASDRPDGPQHGYFFLAVGGAGSYTVVVAKTGYRGAEIGEYDVTRRGVVSLGEVEITRTPTRSTTRCTLDAKRVGRGERGAVSVKVATSATPRPVGDVRLTVDGRKVDTKRLRASSRGALDLGLPKLAVGSHRVKASWAGATYVAGSSCAPVTLTVRKTAARIAWRPGDALLRLLP